MGSFHHPPSKKNIIPSQGTHSTTPCRKKSAKDIPPSSGRFNILGNEPARVMEMHFAAEENHPLRNRTRLSGTCFSGMNCGMPSATMINGLHNRPSSDATKIACQPPADQLKSSEFFSADASVFSHPTSTFLPTTSTNPYRTCYAFIFIDGDKLTHETTSSKLLQTWDVAV